ncbi:MAG TPA: hypothetical protein VNZ45_13115 [Bacteroidia bacterium]|jgi:hypothetical protein|nr:hypothetical protein [Bacteroidia bacterium]
MRSFLILFLLALASASNAQIDAGDDAMPPYKMPKAGAFVDSLQPKDSIKAFYLSSSNGFPDVLEDTAKIFHDSAFNKHDVLFLRKQLLDSRTREWMASDNVWGATIVPQGEILEYSRKGSAGWDKFHKKYGKGFFVYSYPVFSVNGMKAVLAKSYHTNGKGNYGSIYLYENLKGKWKVVKTYSTWNG